MLWPHHTGCISVCALAAHAMHASALCARFVPDTRLNLLMQQPGAQGDRTFVSITRRMQQMLCIQIGLDRSD